MNYPIAPGGIFSTIQGEGILLGLPMIFVRFAGCSVGCPQCDTDYNINERIDLEPLIDRISQLYYGGVKWVWLTGGEPTDRDITPIINGCRDLGLRVALATAGTKKVQMGSAFGGVDFISVSPHKLDESWVQRRGDQLNIVPGLNDLKLSDLEEVDVSGFVHRFVTPCYGTSVRECLDWVRSHKGWKLGIQSHKVWGVP